MNNNISNINEFIFKLENPQVYTGQEINAVTPKPGNDTIDICLVFPDTYEIGMSHYGLKILYHLLNTMENVNAERCFLPTKASIATFYEHKVPLFSLESKRPLYDFDMVGFSLLSEMTYTNVLQILDLAHIPLRREQRKKGSKTYPIIAAGGISVANPEPLRDFVDVFAVGDGEVLFPEIITTLFKGKKDALSREECTALLDDIDGIYVPACSPLEKKGNVYVPEIKKGKKRKRIIKDLDASKVIPEHKIIVPLTNVVFNRLTVEIARGCPQTCRFCQAKSYYSPYRAQTPGKNLENITEGLSQTGFDAFSLSSLSAGDYPWMEQLLPLIPRVISAGTSFSLPSLRPSTLSENLLSTLSLFRRTGITIVPEAGTERLRKVINKDVTDDEIFKAVQLALRYNWQKIKLYFMIGLPTETMEDIDGIIQLIGKIKDTAAAARKKISIHASFSTFVPKPHTPLQWVKRESLASLREKINYLKQHLKKTKRLDLDIHLPNKGIVETILTRGDYRVGQLLEDAFRNGEIFSAWDSDFHYQEWRKLIDGTDYEIFLNEMDVDAPLPWDFIELNYKKEYLVSEYKKAHEALSTSSCLKMECGECKGCFYGMKPPSDEDDIPSEYKSPVTGLEEKRLEEKRLNEKANDEIQYNKIRVFYEKTGDYIFFSHLSMIKYVERFIRKANIKFKCTEGYHPRMRITSLPPLPVFASGKAEAAELFLDGALSESEILEKLNIATNGTDFKFTQVMMTNRSRPLPKDIRLVTFEITMPGIMDYATDTDKNSVLKNLMADTDCLSWEADKMILTIDYANGGQERFGKIYRMLDPGKQHTRHLTRTLLTYKELLPVTGP